MNVLIQQIAQQISQQIDSPFDPKESQQIQGGCINQALRLSDGNQHYFVKINHSTLLRMFEAEQRGLKTLAKSKSIRIPKPICSGIVDNQAYLVLEYIDFFPAQADSYRKAGTALAKMHKKNQSKFGWHISNTIGSTLQINEYRDDWVVFWQQNRLQYQLNLAQAKRATKRLIDDGTRLVEKLPLLFKNYKVVPSLLHGDLWTGNLSFDQQGNAVIYDPAVYYGDRETDIAMTQLFGSFDPSFYHAYNEAYPLQSGYQTRAILYNLYHILNHFHLFGGGYQTQAENMIKTLLAHLN